MIMNDIPVLGLGCSLLKNRDPKRQSGCEFYHLTSIDALYQCVKYEKILGAVNILHFRRIHTDRLTRVI